MLKSDSHMANVKSRLLRQQAKIKSFEEKKQRAENKKFHKAIKDFKMKAKHAEKRQNLEQIQKLKKRVQEKGDDIDQKEFDKIMRGPSSGQRKSKQSVIDTVKSKVQQRRKQKSKKPNRPGKVARMAGKR